MAPNPGQPGDAVRVSRDEAVPQPQLPLRVVSVVYVDAGDEQRGPGHGRIEHLVRQQAVLTVEGETLHDSPGEILKRFRRETLMQNLVTAVQLGVGLLQQGRPELGRVSRVEVHQPAFVSGQAVVDQHLDPVSKVPKAEAENAAITVLEVLIRRHDPVQEPGRQRQ